MGWGLQATGRRLSEGAILRSACSRRTEGLQKRNLLKSAPPLFQLNSGEPALCRQCSAQSGTWVSSRFQPQKCPACQQLQTEPWATSSEGAALIWFEPWCLLKKLTRQHLKSGYPTKKPGLGLHEVSEPLLVWPSLLLGALQPPVCQPPPGSVKEKPTPGDEVACTWATSSRACNPVSLTKGPGQGQAAPARVLPWPVLPLLEL